MQNNVDQHRAFTPGFEAFDAYSRKCNPRDFDPRELRRLIEAFAQPLIQHLNDEIKTLRELRRYDSDQVRQAYKQLEKKLMDTDNNRIAPLVFGTADRSFEGGKHDFPSVPFFVPYIIHHLFGRKYRGAWRFNPSTAWRDPQELAFGEGNRRS
ncbi:hypothetical protein KVT40_004185 [Elsinoe batatas]|uniref:Uncharacterized protein n=1 Tax=Elsinoe batatas TaxID=2601811 RepID=A0A8K0L396_9PEZI|nr:hypothetical protein KVT40_004185 [Elsinoe batatas]